MNAITRAIVIENKWRAQRYGVRISTRVVDVAKRDEVEAWAAATQQGLGGCDIVINNAGGSPVADAATASPPTSQ